MADCVPDPILFGPQNWEQPDDLHCAKQLLGKMRGAKTKALRKVAVFPLAKINGVIQHAHLEWSRLDKKTTDHLIAVGNKANATHIMLCHNPNGLPTGDTDKETIQRIFPQIQSIHFDPRPAHQDESLGLLSMHLCPPLPHLPSATHNFPDCSSPPLLSVIQFDSKRGRLLVHLFFCIHISQVDFEGVPRCVPVFFFPSVHLVPIFFCNDMLNLTTRTMRGGCSASSVFEVSLETVPGHSWLWFTPMTLMFESINKKQ